ncbi:Exocyst complex component EXO70H1, partial [Cucurbita argyrosperma subsp. sororia]
MPRKGMRSLLFQFSSPSNSISRYSISSPSRSPALTPRRSFNDAMIEQSIESAAAIVMKWNPDSSTYAKVTSMFYEDRNEAMQFIKRVNDLQKAMHLMVSEDSGFASDRLVYAQGLMEIAMKRLQKEFYQILSMNRAHLDPESVSARSSRCSTRSSTSADFDDDGTLDDEVQVVGDSIAEVEQVSSIVMEDLRTIAECMISSGYAKECVNMYKVIRKSIIDEGVYRLGLEKLSPSRINKMDWEVLDLKIKNWLDAIKLAIRTLFVGERILCDNVFSSSESIRESCFADISREGALLLFGFPELVAKSKKSPEKMFRVLDMYSSIAENWPEIESIFSSESSSIVRSQALTSLAKLGELVRAIVMDLEFSIQKNSSKSPVAGGGVHSLTLLSMNYLTFLADYGNVLTDIFADWIPQDKSSLEQIFFGSSDSDDSPTASAISLRMGWLILVLLCKLDSKAKRYKDVSLSYLFLANNLQHIVSKVRSSNLHYLLGDEWIAKHEAKVRQFAAKYEALAWGRVFDSLPENPTEKFSQEEVKEIFRNFNMAFQETHRKQKSCFIPDPKLRDEVKLSIGRKLVSFYGEFYRAQKAYAGAIEKPYIRFSPEDIGNYLSDLYFEPSDWASVSTSSPSSTSSSHRREPGPR